MNFDERAAARRRAKKLKYDLKELRKEMLSAGGDKPQTGNDLKELQEVLQLGRTLRMDYAKARTHLSRGRESIAKLLECMAESPVDEVRTSLDALVVDLESVYHDCSIREDDLDYQSTIQSLKQMVEQYAENAKDAKTEAGRAFASIMLRSELENIKAVLDDAAGWQEPDFLALAYYVLHGNREALGEMENEQRNVYVLSYFNDAFMAGFLERCGRLGVETRLQALIDGYAAE